MALTADTKLASPGYADTVIHQVISATITLAANEVRNFNVATTLGSKVSEYLLSTTAVDVLVLDNETGSPTNGYYIPGTAVIASGIKINGEVRVVNTYTDSITALVRITVRRKASQ